MDEGVDEDLFSGPPDPNTNFPKKGRAETVPAFFYFWESKFMEFRTSLGTPLTNYTCDPRSKFSLIKAK
jgi:hypothetical protein